LYPVSTEMAAKFLKALTIMCGTAGAVTIPDSKLKAVMFLTPLWKASNN
jgi:hypothetical protein